MVVNGYAKCLIVKPNLSVPDEISREGSVVDSVMIYVINIPPEVVFITN